MADIGKDCQWSDKSLA